MKVLFPVQVFYPSQAGGPANTVFWLAKHLKANGFEPTIVSTDMGINGASSLNEWVETEAGRTIYVRTRHQYFPLRQTLISLRELYSADIVHLSSLLFPTAFITGIFARLFGKKIAWSPRGELDDYSLSYSRSRKLPVLWLIQKLAGVYPLYHSTSDEETSLIQKRFGNDARIRQIINFVEIEPMIDRKPSNYLLFIGRLNHKKGIDLLLRAVATSKEFRSKGSILKIAGTGPESYKGYLKELSDDLGLASAVEFLGQVEGIEKQRLYANAYFTFMPSHSENFGNVVVESLAQGTPVVASKGTPWRSLEDERIGHWIENDIQSLANTIDEILRMPEEEYTGYRSRARGYVERNLDIRNNFDQWLQFYAEI